MPQTFKCSSCGAAVEYDGSGYATMRCPFCNNSVVVPQELRVRRDSPSASASSPSATPPGTPMMSGDQGEMFDLGNLLAQAGRFKELGELVRAGRKTEAAQLYRELLGVDEATAMQAVESMASGQPVVMTSNVTTFEAPSITVTTSTIQPTTGVGGVGSMPRTYITSGGSPARRTGATVGLIVGCLAALIIVAAVLLSLVFFLAFSGS
ncbi:MAG: hypothetical protein HYZ49_08425 [Chloroflexi bacterium]|nr:hypothetical protein [Chloroflexota bacterium]